MLEYSLELEQKIAGAGLATGDTICVLALCGDGFHWHRDQLEDFVAPPDSYMAYLVDSIFMPGTSAPCAASILVGKS